MERECSSENKERHSKNVWIARWKDFLCLFCNRKYIWQMHWEHHASTSSTSSSVHMHVCFTCRVGTVLLTKNKNSMPQWLRTVGLHSNIQNGGISPDDTNAVVLLCLAEHSQELIGYDPIECRYGHHWYHKGQKCIHLFRSKHKRS